MNTLLFREFYSADDLEELLLPLKNVLFVAAKASVKQQSGSRKNNC